MMTERYVYTIAAETSDAEQVEQLMEKIAAATGVGYRIEASYVCDACGSEWSENRCRFCAAEGHE